MNDTETFTRRTKTRGGKMRARTPEAKAHVLRLAERLGSVSRACQIMGYSRDSFYRFKRLYEEGGVAALERPSRRKPLLKNRVAPEIERGVVEVSKQHPSWGRARVADALVERGWKISPSGVRCVWVRHGLETVAQRLSAAHRPHSPQRLPSQQSTLAQASL
jgi:transposase